MSKIKQEYFDLALQTGGSHYPGVGGQLLSTFGDMVAKECIRIALENGEMLTVYAIEQRFGITNGVQL
jgi:hypothetical protein